MTHRHLSHSLSIEPSHLPIVITKPQEYHNVTMFAKISPITTLTSNLVRMTRFLNNLHLVRSLSKEWKPTNLNMFRSKTTKGHKQASQQLAMANYV